VVLHLLKNGAQKVKKCENNEKDIVKVEGEMVRLGEVR
jgi:hypothetical protein